MVRWRFVFIPWIIPAVMAFAMSWACMEVEQKADFSVPLEDGAAISYNGIIGGTATGYDSWQSVVMVHGGYFMSCTGTLIHPRVVLSAGHCVKLKAQQGMPGFDFTKTPRQIWIGGGLNGYQRYATAEKIVAHPSWNGELAEGVGDLSLIYLSKEITGIPVSKLRDFPIPEAGDKGIVVGYGGNTSTMPPKGSGVHREGETTLLSVNPKLIETGEWANTCQGDSGGPMFTEQNGEWVVSGVTSFGTAACAEGGGSFSVNVLAYCSWLNDTFTSFVGHDLGLEGCTTCKATKASKWGQACGEGYAPCPSGTACIKPEGFSYGGFGYCGAECCTLSYEEKDYCTEVSAGLEKCGIIDDEGKTFCSIECEDDDDCPQNTSCKKKPYTDEKLCIATREGPGWDPSETDVDDTDEGGESGDTGDGAGSGESGSDIEEGSSGAEANAQIDGNSSGTGCSINLVTSSHRARIFTLVLVWLFG